MIKLIATDVDGTLVKDGTMQIDPEYMTVIKELVQKGIIFAVCSGRQFISERKLFAPIKDQLLYITDGGTVVRTPQEILMVHTMPRDVWSGMCRMVQEQMPHCDCFVATPDYCLAEDAGSRMFHWLRDSYGYDIREAERLADIPEQDIIKFTVYHKSACEEMCAPLFTPAWKDKAQLAAAGKEWMDCNPLGANKGTAIEFVQKHFGISPEETCTFGDNLNDIGGIRVICPFIQDIYTVADMLMRQSDLTLIEKKDYIANPKPNGYRSLHLILEVPIFLSETTKPVRIELQLRTIAMDFWASLEHQLRYKSDVQVPPHISDDLKECADVIAATDEEMQRIAKELHVLR